MSTPQQQQQQQDDGKDKGSKPEESQHPEAKVGGSIRFN